MAWVRTATALIAFGFSIVQFFERLKSMEGVAPAPYPHLARYFGLGLIAAGILGLLVSVWQYRVLNGYLWREFRSIASAGDGPRVTPTLVVSLVLLLIGIYAFVTVFTRAV